MPTGVPLALWLYSRTGTKGGSTNQDLETFMLEVIDVTYRSLYNLYITCAEALGILQVSKGVVCTLGFAAVGWMMARRGNGVATVVLAGYAGWGVVWLMLRAL